MTCNNLSSAFLVGLVVFAPGATFLAALQVIATAHADVEATAVAVIVVVAINVQYQTGGNLAEILSRLSRLIRNRARLRLKIGALSAEGRVSALVLSLMPLILFGGISLISPGYFTEVRDHPLVAPAVIYAVISLLVGNVIMHRMVNFKF